MKIISWNVNGIRAIAKKGFTEFVYRENPDILCLQEAKAFESQFLKEIGELEGYNYVWHSGTRAGYAGTAIFFKKEIKIISTKNQFDEINHFHDDGRITEIIFEKDGKQIVLINGYFPNGGTRADGTEMLTYKLEFYDKLINYINSLVKEKKEVIITGDFNICHTEIDIARPKENENSIGFLPIERKKITELLENGYIDTFRYFYPEKVNVYSWWSYRGGARPRNVGWRLDYFVVNKDFIDEVSDMVYMTEIEGSDHCPIKLLLK
ncbi:exodeoxyribonuclease III [Candidatus Gracilibacteria bacterium]|nr:MAG: exodeoxyribonuclease III [Candidatus Gracilibacteria bacterium]